VRVGVLRTGLLEPEKVLASEANVGCEVEG